MARRRGEQVEVYVTIGSLKYGFKTTKSVHNSYKSELGQTTYAGSAGVFFGANSPKPPRATKEFASGTIGSYCSTDKISSLKSNGWTVSRKARIRGVKTAGKTRTVYVDMPGGWKYAWNITASEADLASELGFVLATGADATDLIWGVNYPKPPRASKTDENGTTSTFMKPQNSAIGVGAFKKSTLRKLVNQSDFLGAAKQFGRWVNANGKKLPGLVKRRAEEKKLFLS